MSKHNQNIAVIDLGSHSTLLLIGHVGNDGRVYPIKEQFAVSRLGERLDETGKLAASAMQQAIEILEEFGNTINQYHVSHVHLLGTEALRRAKNAEDFRQRLRKQFSWDLKILTTDREAELSFKGAVEGFFKAEEHSLVIDVGGGSTEIVAGCGLKPVDSHSLSIGALRLFDCFQRKTQLDSATRRQIDDYLKSQLEKTGFAAKLTKSAVLIGTGGTITTLAAILKEMTVYDAEALNGMVIKRPDLENLFTAINAKSLKERRNITGLEKGREDIIIYGMLIYLNFMKLFDFREIMVSTRGLRFAYLREMAEANENEMIVDSVK